MPFSRSSISVYFSDCEYLKDEYTLKSLADSIIPNSVPNTIVYNTLNSVEMYIKYDTDPYTISANIWIHPNERPSYISVVPYIAGLSQYENNPYTSMLYVHLFHNMYKTYQIPIVNMKTLLEGINKFFHLSPKEYIDLADSQLLNDFPFETVYGIEAFPGYSVTDMIEDDPVSFLSGKYNKLDWKYCDDARIICGLIEHYAKSLI